MKFISFIVFILTTLLNIKLTHSELYSPYAILGVNPLNSFTTIKKLFKELSVKHHPDRIKNHDQRIAAKEQFVIIQNAFEAIKVQREKFDELDYIALGFIYLYDLMDYYGVEDYYYRMAIEIIVQVIALVILAICVYLFKNGLRKLGILAPKGGYPKKDDETIKKDNSDINTKESTTMTDTKEINKANEIKESNNNELLNEDRTKKNQ